MDYSQNQLEMLWWKKWHKMTYDEIVNVNNRIERLQGLTCWLKCNHLFPNKNNELKTE